MYPYTTVDIRPEPKSNILNFGYGIRFKHEGILSHSIDRFYVVTKFILPVIDDITISAITFDIDCSYLNIILDSRTHTVHTFQFVLK